MRGVPAGVAGASPPELFVQRSESMPHPCYSLVCGVCGGLIPDAKLGQHCVKREVCTLVKFEGPTREVAYGVFADAVGSAFAAESSLHGDMMLGNVTGSLTASYTSRLRGRIH